MRGPAGHRMIYSIESSAGWSLHYGWLQIRSESASCKGKAPPLSRSELFQERRGLGVTFIMMAEDTGWQLLSLKKVQGTGIIISDLSEHRFEPNFIRYQMGRIWESDRAKWGPFKVCKSGQWTLVQSLMTGKWIFYADYENEHHLGAFLRVLPKCRFKNGEINASLRVLWLYLLECISSMLASPALAPPFEDLISRSGPNSQYPVSQSEASIQVMWSLSANQQSIPSQPN